MDLAKEGVIHRILSIAAARRKELRAGKLYLNLSSSAVQAVNNRLAELNVASAHIFGHELNSGDRHGLTAAERFAHARGSPLVPEYAVAGSLYDVVMQVTSMIVEGANTRTVVADLAFDAFKHLTRLELRGLNVAAYSGTHWLRQRAEQIVVTRALPTADHLFLADVPAALARVVRTSTPADLAAWRTHLDANGGMESVLIAYETAVEAAALRADVGDVGDGLETGGAGSAAGAGLRAGLEAAQLEALIELVAEWRFRKLVTLSLARNSLSVLDSSLALAPHVRHLDVSQNSISSIAPLCSMPELETLSASFNTISSLAGLDRACPRLRVLSVRSNRLSTLAGVEGLTGLVRLDVRDNFLATPDALRPLRGLLRLQAVGFAGNPLTADPRHRALILAVLGRSGRGGLVSGLFDMLGAHSAVLAIDGQPATAREQGMATKLLRNEALFPPGYFRADSETSTKSSEGALRTAQRRAHGAEHTATDAAAAAATAAATTSGETAVDADAGDAGFVDAVTVNVDADSRARFFRTLACGVDWDAPVGNRAVLELDDNAGMADQIAEAEASHKNAAARVRAGRDHRAAAAAAATTSDFTGMLTGQFDPVGAAAGAAAAAVADTPSRSGPARPARPGAAASWVDAAAAQVESTYAASKFDIDDDIGQVNVPTTGENWLSALVEQVEHQTAAAAAAAATDSDLLGLGGHASSLHDNDLDLALGTGASLTHGGCDSTILRDTVSAAGRPGAGEEAGSLAAAPSALAPTAGAFDDLLGELINDAEIGENPDSDDGSAPSVTADQAGEAPRAGVDDGFVDEDAAAAALRRLPRETLIDRAIEYVYEFEHAPGPSPLEALLGITASANADTARIAHLEAEAEAAAAADDSRTLGHAVRRTITELNAAIRTAERNTRLRRGVSHIEALARQAAALIARSTAVACPPSFCAYAHARLCLARASDTRLLRVLVPVSGAMFVDGGANAGTSSAGSLSHKFAPRFILASPSIKLIAEYDPALMPAAVAERVAQAAEPAVIFDAAARCGTACVRAFDMAQFISVLCPHEEFVDPVAYKIVVPVAADTIETDVQLRRALAETRAAISVRVDELIDRFTAAELIDGDDSDADGGHNLARHIHSDAGSEFSSDGETRYDLFGAGPSSKTATPDGSDAEFAGSEFAASEVAAAIAGAGAGAASSAGGWSDNIDQWAAPAAQAGAAVTDAGQAADHDQADVVLDLENIATEFAQGVLAEAAIDAAAHTGIRAAFALGEDDRANAGAQSELGSVAQTVARQASLSVFSAAPSAPLDRNDLVALSSVRDPALRIAAAARVAPPASAAAPRFNAAVYLCAASDVEFGESSAHDVLGALSAPVRQMLGLSVTVQRATWASCLVCGSTFRLPPGAPVFCAQCNRWARVSLGRRGPDGRLMRDMHRDYVVMRHPLLPRDADPARDTHAARLYELCASTERCVPGPVLRAAVAAAQLPTPSLWRLRAAVQLEADGIQPTHSNVATLARALQDSGVGGSGDRLWDAAEPFDPQAHGRALAANVIDLGASIARHYRMVVETRVSDGRAQMEGRGARSIFSIGTVRDAGDALEAESVRGVWSVPFVRYAYRDCWPKRVIVVATTHSLVVLGVPTTAAERQRPPVLYTRPMRTLDRISSGLHDQSVVLDFSGHRPFHIDACCPETTRSIAETCLAAASAAREAALMPPVQTVDLGPQLGDLVCDAGAATRTGSDKCLAFHVLLDVAHRRLVGLVITARSLSLLSYQSNIFPRALTAGYKLPTNVVFKQIHSALEWSLETVTLGRVSPDFTLEWSVDQEPWSLCCMDLSHRARVVADLIRHTKITRSAVK